MLTWTTTTPPGPFTVLSDGHTVFASGWTDDAELLCHLVAPALHDPEIVEVKDLGAVSAAVEAYHRGEVTAVDTVAVRQSAGPFLTRARQVLRSVPAGAPVAYAELARRAGRPAAVRAAASACARNATALFVPCHRVLRTDGSLGGYRWGLDVKQWLLDHEATPARLNPVA